MKIKVWTKYNVSYLPPRCRKLRYREEEEYMYVNIKEVKKEELIPAFDTGFIIYSYNKKLWRKASERDTHCVDDENTMTALEALIKDCVTCSTYFGRYNYANGDISEADREDRTAVRKRLLKDMREYIIVNNELYIQTTEPLYCIYTFGLGHNHAGIGTSLSIDYHYNSNISKERYFNALEFDKALNKALEIAINRGDTDSIRYIKALEPIKVYDKKFVHHKPQKEHGNGNPLLNSIEASISSSKDSTEAALLTMASISSEIANNK